MSDGMPSNSVFDIAQDKNGIMWFATKAGPTFYDSRKWMKFPDSLGLPTSMNTKVRADYNKTWAAGLNDTAFTIQYFQRNNWNKIKVPYESMSVPGDRKLQKHFAFDVQQAQNQSLLLLGLDSILYFTNTQSINWETIILSANQINEIKCYDSNTFIATQNGLFKFETNELSKIKLPDELPNNQILSFEVQNNYYYLLGYNWFAKTTSDSLVYLIEDAGLNQNSITYKSSVVVDNELVLFGSYTPARIVDEKNNSWRDLLIDGRNINILSTKVFIDREKNVWVSDTRGLFKFNALLFENYNANSGLSEDEVTAIYPLQNGDLILANPLSFNILNTSVNKYNIQKANQFNVRILDVVEDVQNNHLLFATNDGGLMIYSTNDFQSPLQIIESPQLRFTTVELFNGAVYVAGDAGIWKKEGKAFTTILDLESTRNLGVLGDQLGIFSIYDGVYTYDGKELHHFNSNIIDLNNVYDGVVYQEKTLLATSAGLATIKNKKILLASDFDIRTPVYSLLNDSQNNLWIGTDHGVYKFNGYDLKLYDYDKGLLGNEVNRNALIEDASGNIWIGTEKGASVFKGDIALTRIIQ